MIKSCNAILTEKQQKYKHYHQANIDKYEYVTSGEILLSDQITMKLSLLFSLKKSFGKTNKKMGDQSEKQRKLIEEHGKKPEPL